MSAQLTRSRTLKTRPCHYGIRELQDSLARGIIFSDLTQSGHDGRPYANDDFLMAGGLGRILVFRGLVTSVLVGAIHLVGWNFEFPTPVDSWLWRVAALVSTGLVPFLFMLATLVLEMVVMAIEDVNGWDPLPPGSDVKSSAALKWGAFGLYGLARLVLVVEMFRCLFYPPPDAFTSTWTVNIPHIG